MIKDKIVVVGAGSWGTALALVLANKGCFDVTMWEYNKELAEKMERERENEKLLPGVKFPDNLHVTNDDTDLLKDAKAVVFSIPSQVLRGVVARFSNQMRSDLLIVNTGKGIEISSGLRLSEVIKDEILGKYHNNIVVLSGPTHAEEVCKGIPTTIVAAGKLDKAKAVQEIFTSEVFRVYVNEDMIGVELGAAVKNCLALGAGISDGLGFGDNTKAALITRGVAEMIRFGEKLGRGETLKEILDGMTMVAEGVPTVKAVYTKAQELNVSMPIVEAVYKVLYEDEKAAVMVRELMSRDLKEEF